jgi:hypothetical protein
MQADLFQYTPATYCPPLTDTPRARRTDPETSHMAAQRIKASGALGCQQSAVFAAVRQWPGSTAVELARLAGMDRYAVSRRLPELEPVHVRRGEARTCEANGRPQVTWWPA